MNIKEILIDFFGCVPFVAASKLGTKGPIYLTNENNIEVYEANRSNIDSIKIPKKSQIDLSLMENEDYLKFLNSQPFNFSAFLGELAPDHLCSIDFDDEEFEKLFFENNPKIKDTLITGANRKQIWVKIKDDPPSPVYLTMENKKHVGEFRSTGWCCLFFGKHPNGNEYKKLNQNKPISIYFEDIKWPKELKFSRFHFSGVSFPIDLINKRKSFHHKFFINKNDLDCPPEDYSHLAVSYMDSNTKEIFRYDVCSEELLFNWDKNKNNLEIDRYFELPESPRQLWIEPYSKTKKFRKRIIFILNDINSKKFNIQEKINANWIFA